MNDTYRLRSAYTAAIVENYWGYDSWEFSENQPVDWVKKINREYLSVRPYLSCDYYPLVPFALDDSGWTAWQYDRPEENDGIVMAFRRCESPMSEAVFNLSGIKRGCTYLFEEKSENNEKNEKFEISGDDITENGFIVNISKKRDSKLYFYRIIK
jgi:alpha-galactosidase